MKTHKVINITYTNEPLIYGSCERCYEWKEEQGLRYKVVPLNKEEKLIANEF